MTEMVGDRQWGMIDTGEWYTNRNERWWEIADMIDNGKWQKWWIIDNGEW